VKPIDPVRLQEQVGRRVAELRSELDLTQAELAELVGVSLRYLQSVEGGRENLGLATLAKLASVLKVTPIRFFEPPTTKKARPGRPKKAE